MPIECKSYRPFEKGALQGFCELHLPGPPGMTIKDIGVFLAAGGQGTSESPVDDDVPF